MPNVKIAFLIKIKVLLCVLLINVIFPSFYCRITGVTADDDVPQPTDEIMDDPCMTVKCSAETKCVTIYPNCLKGSTNCKPKGICISKRVPRKAADSDCPPWSECRSGFCVPIGRRRRNTFNDCAEILCPMDSICIKGKCIPVSSQNSKDNLIQIRKICQSECPCPIWSDAKMVNVFLFKFSH